MFYQIRPGLKTLKNTTNFINQMGHPLIFCVCTMSVLCHSPLAVLCLGLLKVSARWWNIFWPNYTMSLAPFPLHALYRWTTLKLKMIECGHVRTFEKQTYRPIQNACLSIFLLLCWSKWELGGGGVGTQRIITRLSVQAVVAENSLRVSIVWRFVLGIVC